MTKKLMLRVAQDVINLAPFFQEDELLDSVFRDAMHNFICWLRRTYPGRAYRLRPAPIHFRQAVDNFCTDIAQMCSTVREMPPPERDVTLSLACVADMLRPGSHGLTDFSDLYPSPW